MRQLSDVPVSEKDMSWSKSTCMIEGTYSQHTDDPESRPHASYKSEELQVDDF